MADESTGQAEHVNGDHETELDAARREVRDQLAELFGSFDFGTFTAVQSAKGGEHDPVSQLTFKPQGQLSWEKRDELSRHNWLAHNYVKRFAREATRSWVSLRVEGDPEHPLAVAAEQYGRRQKVDLRSTFRHAIQIALDHGDGFGAIGLDEGNTDLSLADKVDLNAVQSLDYINVFDGKNVQGGEQDEDPWSETFKQLVRLDLVPLTEAEQKQKRGRSVDLSRIIHVQSEEDPFNKPWGASVHERLWPIYRLNNIAQSSIELLFYRLVLIVFTSDDFYRQMQSEDPETVRAAREKIQQDLSYLNIWLKSSDEELDVLSMAGSLGNITPLLEFVRDVTSGSLEMGKHLIYGSAAGELTSSEEDTMRFHDVLHGFQEDVLRKEVEWVYTLILAALINSGDEAAQGFGSIDDVSWQLEFNAIRQMTEQERAEIESNHATALSRKTTAITAAFEAAGIGQDEYLSVMESIWGERLSSGTVDEALSEMIEQVPAESQPEMLDALLGRIVQDLSPDAQQKIVKWAERVGTGSA